MTVKDVFLTIATGIVGTLIFECFIKPYLKHIQPSKLVRYLLNTKELLNSQINSNKSKVLVNQVYQDISRSLVDESRLLSTIYSSIILIIICWF